MEFIGRKKELKALEDAYQGQGSAFMQVPAGEKIVLVMDEFQWTVGASLELPSVLQSLIDDDWGGRCKVFLILCGSYMGFMFRQGGKSAVDQSN